MTFWRFRPFLVLFVKMTKKLVRILTISTFHFFATRFEKSKMSVAARVVLIFSDPKILFLNRFHFFDFKIHFFKNREKRSERSKPLSKYVTFSGILDFDRKSFEKVEISTFWKFLSKVSKVKSPEIFAQKFFKKFCDRKSKSSSGKIIFDGTKNKIFELPLRSKVLTEIFENFENRKIGPRPKFLRKKLAKTGIAFRRSGRTFGSFLLVFCDSENTIAG